MGFLIFSLLRNLSKNTILIGFLICTVIGPSLEGPWVVGWIIVPQRTQSMILDGLGHGPFSSQDLTLLEAYSRVSW